MTTQTAPQFRTTFREPKQSLRFAGVLTSEFIKLVSIRSLTWSLVIGAALVIITGPLATAGIIGLADGQMTTLSLTSFATIGVVFAQLVFAVIGVIAITGEYSTGQIRSSFTAVPKRLPVLGAKALVLGVTSFIVSVVAVAISGALVVIVGGAFGITGANVDTENFGLALFGSGLFMAVLTVFSLMIGALLRNAAGAISIVLALLLVVPSVFAFVPIEWVTEIGTYQLPSAGGMLSVPQDGLGGEWLKNLAVAIAWPAIASAAAALLLVRRDA